jgi:porphobilinogen synthase
MSGFPALRMRRLRRTDTLRQMVAETRLAPSDFILPYFVTHGSGVRAEVSSMPGVFQLSTDELARDVREAAALGIPAVLLFGLPAVKDEYGSEAYDPDGIVQRGIRTIKDVAPDLVVVGDVCLCEYTSHGHCGVVRGNQVVNDETIELLGRTALSSRHRT